MVLVKILGAIDITAAVAFLMLVFGMTVPLQYTLFCAGLLLLKGMFIFTGDILSVVDIFCSLILMASIFFAVPMIFLWIPAFLLCAKGFVSFI